MFTLVVIAAIAVLIALWFMGTYNKLIRLRNVKDEAWSGIDVQLKRRFDLIPNLVETVKGYAAHEKETLENVTNARAAVNQAGDDPAARMQAENFLTGTLRSLFAVAENYPDLKASNNFIQLQGQLSSIEDEIQMSRRTYNGSARDLNTAAQSFPAVIVAKHLGFSDAPYFEAEEEAKAVPKVSFTDAPKVQPSPSSQPIGFDAAQTSENAAPAETKQEDKKIGF